MVGILFATALSPGSIYSNAGRAARAAGEYVVSSCAWEQESRHDVRGWRHGGKFANSRSAFRAGTSTDCCVWELAAQVHSLGEKNAASLNRSERRTVRARKALPSRGTERDV
jgi:hypothetical protein